MPTYTIRNEKTGIEETVICSWKDLQAITNSEHITHVLKPLQIISSTGSLGSKRPDGFTDVLKEMKKKAGRGNTIKI